ncbi:MAG: ATP-dependent DNA helicase RecG [Bacteroidetes bacterium GWE2_41_25]|nr:MAG: ATP-dependent DNA helicase RecG [Bacteroidetes bacterium GWA2_40_15]OFX92758.1 MAG: ATP-dependent DNA helicase RecG [Bacteroidetes bacterium GWE2_41_25]OFX94880.1 MAG: ATP-dependent DNA helicase RecG [Bacteroidetes bacterium GWC2_40_22]HBQ83864.1 ATP-dependent DNA helicase RecG [Bacteroidales bacterium]HCU19237.1 ATP-dependent DNA helicase RecG [Bacteroidales bacterium]
MIVQEFLDTNITYLTGVGPKRAEHLNKEISVFNFRDFLYYFPYKYIDRTRFYKIEELDPDLPFVQIKGHIKGYYSEGHGKGKRLTADFQDETGTIKLIWFKGTKWITGNYTPGIEYIIFGKPSVFNGMVNIIHPEIEACGKASERLNSALQAQYSTTEKLKNNFITSKTINKLIGTLLKQIRGRLPETLPSYLVSQYKLIDLHDAIHRIHFPSNPEELEKARYRLKFDELFYIQLNLLRLRSNRNLKLKGFVFSTVGKFFNSFYHNNLPFTLTEAQKRVMKEIRKDLGSGRQMNRLLQGDVGSGKTLVALMSMLIAIDNGYQACIMAPTEILANQHYNTICRLLHGIDIKICLLTGSSKRTSRKSITESLLDKSLHILIGTHALIEENVRFSNLGLVIIDEQHRFGVEQRARLWQKNLHPPHILVMTATPIPRTLAMTLYGDLDVSVIDELPPGRVPVKTMHFTDPERNKVFGFIRNQIAEGRQIYFVYPLIKESETMDYKDLEDGWDTISRVFPSPKYCLSVVHGKMTPADKERSMKLFKEGHAHILVATTVIEVGVDIPNASVMVIESAERFGLSQLHQLRGRVGRGADQSYCILMSSEKLTREAAKRLEVLIKTSDGFEIAETDLQLRGPGDIEGTQQSGIPFDLKIASLGQDGQIIEYVRRIAENILTVDPLLDEPQNGLLKAELERLFSKKQSWSKIS